MAAQALCQLSNVVCGWDTAFLYAEARLEGVDDEIYALGESNDFGQLGIGKDVEKMEMYQTLDGMAKVHLNGAINNYCYIMHIITLFKHFLFRYLFPVILIIIFPEKLVNICIA